MQDRDITVTTLATANRIRGQAKTVSVTTARDQHPSCIAHEDDRQRRVAQRVLEQHQGRGAPQGFPVDVSGGVRKVTG